MERWLSLTVSKVSSSKTVHISIPKRIVKHAVVRNRIRRVLREAVRLDPFLQDEKIYILKVLRLPKAVNLPIAQKTLRLLRA
jgi:ribonuclease P protein component